MQTIGRDKEIRSIKSALRRKANVLLIGPRGVGKSHILEHIAEEMKANCYYIPILQPAKSALTQVIAEIMQTPTHAFATLHATVAQHYYARNN